MPTEKLANAEVSLYEVGLFICPNTKTAVPLMAPRALPYLEWPFKVEKCPSCAQSHVLCCEDVQHPPSFGYE